MILYSKDSVTVKALVGIRRIKQPRQLRKGQSWRDAAAVWLARKLGQTSKTTWGSTEAPCSVLSAVCRPSPSLITIQTSHATQAFFIKPTSFFWELLPLSTITPPAKCYTHYYSQPTQTTHVCWCSQSIQPHSYPLSSLKSGKQRRKPMNPVNLHFSLSLPFESSWLKKGHFSQRKARLEQNTACISISVLLGSQLCPLCSLCLEYQLALIRLVPFLSLSAISTCGKHSQKSLGQQILLWCSQVSCAFLPLHTLWYLGFESVSIIEL